MLTDGLDAFRIVEMKILVRFILILNNYTIGKKLVKHLKQMREMLQIPLPPRTMLVEHCNIMV